MHIFTIKSRLEFLDIQNTCVKSLKTSKVILLYKKVTDKEIEESKIKEFSKFGVCVTKKIDKRAVVRNRIKRLLRESFKKILNENNDYILNNYKYEVIAKKEIIESKFTDIYYDLLSLMQQLKEKKQCNSDTL